MKALRILSIVSLCFFSSCFLKDEILKDCQKNNTTEVYFINASTTGKTYDVVWDGSVVATITPGQESSKKTVTANITHSYIFKVAGTSTIACSQGNPNLPSCKTYSYTCSF